MSKACPKCQHGFSSVVRNEENRRRRVCANVNCQHRWTTIEIDRELADNLAEVFFSLAERKNLPEDIYAAIKAVVHSLPAKTIAGFQDKAAEGKNAS